MGYMANCTICGEKISFWKGYTENGKKYCQDCWNKENNILIQINFKTSIPYDRKKHWNKFGFLITGFFTKFFKNVAIAYIPDDLKKSKRLVGIDISCFNLTSDLMKSLGDCLKFLEFVFEKNKINYEVKLVGSLNKSNKEFMEQTKERMLKGDLDSFGMIGSERIYSLIKREEK
jgi:hypothetical protein